MSGKTDSAAKKQPVPINRTPEIIESRSKLPIIGEEQVIMEAISENDVIIVVGETGSGKTTQVPQFLYEAGYSNGNKMIGVTEPRRIAAISVSQRVAEELNETTDIVSYLIRFEGNAGSNTKIKFMTDGVLLKEIQNDFLLNKYSAIILDEAHERRVFSDILIGILSRIVRLRQKRSSPLKLIIMSATLKVDDFSKNQKLFLQPPPIIELSSRQFPVTIHFNKRTPHDYLAEAYNKIYKIHSNLPAGAILVFLTGKLEVKQLVSKLRKAFPYRETDSKISSNTKCKQSIKKEIGKPLPDINLDDYDIEMHSEDELILSDNSSNDDDDEDEVPNKIMKFSSTPLWVLPLYSMLPAHKQSKIFEPPPSGCRMCVISTNVAELSLTIPNVKYVVDCGKTKVREYDPLTSVSRFSVVWESKASANQRAGRAGRTSPGHCYRLFSSALFNNEFPEWNLPEIQTTPIDNVILQMKSMKIDKITSFPFPTPPDKQTILEAEKRLVTLGALEVDRNVAEINNITPLGKSMAAFPLSPHYAKMLCLSKDRSLLQYMLFIISAMSVQEYLPGDNVDAWKKTKLSWANKGEFLLLGDLMVILRSMGGASHAMKKSGLRGLQEYCTKTGLHQKSILEAWKLNNQLINQLNIHVPSLKLNTDLDMTPPTPIQVKQIRQIVLAGMLDKVARRLTTNELNRNGIRPNKAAYYASNLTAIVFIHNSSVLKRSKPEWLVYQEIFEVQDKMYIKGLTAIEPEWLPVYANRLCKTLKVLDDPMPSYNEETGKMFCTVNATYGQAGWLLPQAEIEFPDIEQKYCWLAFFILSGKVFPRLEDFRQHLLSKPDLIVKPWLKFLKESFYLLTQTLNKNHDDSATKIKEHWLKKPTYLLEEYLIWLPQAAHKEVKLIWPPS
ncbi:probable ATP-dependent RNA helicase kurz [Acyrthosiphon pisum]|uniref:RNA helicase n=1 Tax=Acyrthosiphon pisum TaxID=7029 RepID=A0A8R2D459_ACYPI|nr:probable ATP-dependent RNA helicase kurz [Acyrthosiphon pisum]XP_016660591.1 probable ATP-dependent RNA helicase kurz [Acyrthosiphon pisum]|eukprot:XP_001945193.2 PREDICTED: probable ATP-dependent RNA helicase kurz [Acyrthosiphon pisum]